MDLRSTYLTFHPEKIPDTHHLHMVRDGPRLSPTLPWMLLLRTINTVYYSSWRYSTFPSQVQNVPESRLLLDSITWIIPETDCSGEIIPSTTQSSEMSAMSLPASASGVVMMQGMPTLRLPQGAWLISLLTFYLFLVLQPCAIRSSETVGRCPQTTNSKCLIERGLGCRICCKPRGFQVNYFVLLQQSAVPYPSSNARKLVAEPESLDINTIVPIGMRAASSFWATSIGPMVFV